MGQNGKLVEGFETAEDEFKRVCFRFDIYHVRVDNFCR